MEKKNWSEIVQKFADKLITKYNFKTIHGEKKDEMYVYLDGVYEEKGKEIIKIEAEKHMGEFCSTHFVNEVVNKIARKTYIERERLWNCPVNLICVKNGVLDIKNLKLTPHKKDWRFMSKIDVAFDRKKNCPKFLIFLNEVLYEDDIRVAQEWFGYNLYRRYPIKKAMVCKGPKNTGKTQFINILMGFIGEENCANKSLQRLAEGKWQVATLYNKYANISDELSEKAISDVNVFKELTGDSLIDGEIKFGNSFKFRNFAKLTFAANKIPYISVDDSDEAYFDRWIILEFDNRFDDGSSHTKKEIWREIVNDEDEKSGILNWSLVGLKRLLRNGKFSYKKDWKQIRDIMKKENPVYAFVRDCCREKIGEKISKAELFERYGEYCLINNKSPLYEIWKFGKELKKHCEYLREMNEKGVSYWVNLKFNQPDFFDI